MNESKSQLTNRLRREGRWEEASLFKDEEIRRLRAEGLKRPEAQTAAWAAMEQRYPPSALETPEDHEAKSWNGLSQLPSCESDSFFQDAIWVYEHLASSDVTPGDAPHAGAWALLLWARGNRDRFFEQIMPKAYAANQKAKEEQLPDSLDAIDDLSLVDEMLREVVQQREREILNNIPEAVKAEVQDFVETFLEQSEYTVPEAVTNRLIYQMTKLVDDSVKAALRQPEQYRDLHHPL